MRTWRDVQEIQVLERLKELEQTATFLMSQEAKLAMEALDIEMSKLMLQAKKGCRKLYANHYDFSPDVKLWLDKCHSYSAGNCMPTTMTSLQT